jgi:two-component system sensor histidine kinase MprB
MLAVAVGAVSLAALAGRLVASAGLRPVNRLTRAATHIAETQDLHTPIPIDGRDEIAQVSSAFNTMIAALDESRKEQQELIEDAAHELRTPMSSLRTNIDLLVHAGARLPAEDRQALTGDLHRQAAELTDLVDDLVNLARFAAADEPSAPMDLAEVVTDAVERARARNPKASFVIDLPAEPLVVVSGQPTALERAVVNLLDNAVKFGPPDQVVHVRVHRVVAKRQSYAEIAVGDRAPVVPEGERERIFHRFHRLDSARAVPGSGLGLAIVYQTAAAHHGTVAVEPRDGGGNVFCLRLPLT